ncbi:hypothetical protein NFI96_029000 [Prochilodus magdalenae]|nr:hypothetical protein NFI96_029000 [Prochilodus magdalenae]
MGNYRTQLKLPGCPELSVNTLKSKAAADAFPAKKMKRIRNNARVITGKKAHTFAYRQQEVVDQEPSIKDFKDRWPALFQQKEVNAEFQRLMAVPLKERFMAQLDLHSSQLIRVIRAKGGAKGC